MILIASDASDFRIFDLIFPMHRCDETLAKQQNSK